MNLIKVYIFIYIIKKMEAEMKRKLDLVQQAWWDKKEPTEVITSQLQNNLLASEPKELASSVRDELEEKLGALCHVEVKEKWGFFKVCINTKNQPVEGISQVEITITKDLKCNVHLNDDTPDVDIYYYWKNLTKEELYDEIKNIDAFLRGKNMAENSKFKKEVNYDKNRNEETFLAGRGINLDGTRKTPMPKKKE